MRHQSNVRFTLRAMIVLAGAFVYATAGPLGGAPDDPKAIELKVIKYDDLQAAVTAQKGKVVVVDIWAEY
jgi:hypothetical protein